MNKKRFFTSLILAILSLPAIMPLFQKGFFGTDDGEWMIIRFSAFHQALRDGELPVRFLGRLNQEYGYPVANFLYPGFMYLAEPFHLVGFDFVTSIKLLLIFSLLASAFFTYLWLRTFFDKVSSGVGALFYLYTPYHLYDLYQRGSVGELLALAILPFILWQIERKSIFWQSVGIGLLVMSHNTLALLFLGVIALYLLVEVLVTKKKTQQLILFVPLLFGLGLSAFFWIPALYELQYTVFAQTTISQWDSYFASLSLIGYSTFAVLVLTVMLVLTKKLDLSKHRLTLLMFIIGCGSLVMATNVSSSLWQILPVSFVQFPFRFLSVVLICMSFLVACNLSLFKGRNKILLSSAALIILVISAIPFINPKMQSDKGEGYYSTNMATTTVHDEYMPVWVKEKPTQRPEKKVVVVKGNGEVENIVANNKQISFSVTAKEEINLQVQTIYWPGWEAMINGNQSQIMYNNRRGLIELRVPQGNHHVVVRFGETPVRLLSNALSLLSVIGLFILLLYQKHKKK